MWLGICLAETSNSSVQPPPSSPTSKGLELGLLRAVWGRAEVQLIFDINGYSPKFLLLLRGWRATMSDGIGKDRRHRLGTGNNNKERGLFCEAIASWPSRVRGVDAVLLPDCELRELTLVSSSVNKLKH